MNRIKVAAGYSLFVIIINVLGYQYLFSDMEIPPSSHGMILEVPESEPLYRHGNVEVDEDELFCLAENIFHEAGNQSHVGKQAVAFVTLNRVNHVNYPDNICKVVYEPEQFSWTFQNRSIDMDNVIESRVWTIAKQIALDVITEKAYNNLYGVTHYHANYVNPDWGFEKVAVIGDHIFYLGEYLP